MSFSKLCFSSEKSFPEHVVPLYVFPGFSDLSVKGVMMVSRGWQLTSLTLTDGISSYLNSISIFKKLRKLNAEWVNMFRFQFFFEPQHVCCKPFVALSSVLSARLCLYRVHSCFMNEFIFNAFPCSVVLTLPLFPPLVDVSSRPSVCMCSCSSHPSRAVHLYAAESLIEIDSSDGMISDASTKDPSSSDDGEDDDDDDDDGNDSDWGGLGRKGVTETLTCRQPGRLGGSSARQRLWDACLLEVKRRAWCCGDEKSQSVR